MEIVDIESANEFEQVVDKHKVVLVDFWATWCQPCRMLDQIYDQMKNDEELEDIDVVIAKINTENRENGIDQLVANFRISSIPAVFLFRDGKRVQLQDEKGNKMDRVVGVRPKQMYVDLIKHLDDMQI